MACPQCLDMSYRRVGRGIDLWRCSFCGFERIEHEKDEEVLL
jgi:ribosomal protein L37AE/L43A